jgi:Putative redox-active protein (C_GCAxxG_C_C)
LSTVVHGTGMSDRGAVKAAHPLEGGALNRGSTCGVVSGGCLAIALANEDSLASGDGERRAEVYRQLKEYTRWFEERFGSTLCRERTDTSLTTIGGIANYLFSGKAYTRCIKHAGAGAERLVSEIGAPPRPSNEGSANSSSGYCAGPVLRKIRELTGIGSDLQETISVALDGGVGLAGGLCGALAGALMATGIVWGIDPRDAGFRGALGSLLVGEFNTMRHLDRPELWSVAGRVIESFGQKFQSLECLDIARPFDSEQDLADFVERSTTCSAIIDWCADTTSDLILKNT